MKTIMKTRHYILLAACVLAFSACKNETPEARQQADTTTSDAMSATGEAAQPAMESAAASTGAANRDASVSMSRAADAAAAAADRAAAEADAAADPMQEAYEQGKADAAGAIGNAAQNTADNMRQEQAEASRTTRDQN